MGTRPIAARPRDRRSFRKLKGRDTMARHGRAARWVSTTMLAAIMGMAASAAFARSTPAPAPAPAPTAPAPDAQRPNILFVLIADMGYGDLSIMGNTKIQTHNLDKLAREGVLKIGRAHV